MPHCHFYIRVSTEDQATRGVSLATQKRDALAYYKSRLKPRFADLAEGQMFAEEGVSAFKVNLFQRPVGRLLNEALQRGDHVVFVVFDRAFRNPSDFHATTDQWMARGIVIHFLDLQVDGSTPMGEMLLGMRALVARWESRLKGERTRATQAYLKAKGVVYGGRARMGFKITGRKGNKRIVPNPKERAIMQEVVRLRDDKKLTYMEIYREIVRRLKAAGINGPKRTILDPMYWADWTAENAYKKEKEAQAKEAQLRHEAQLRSTRRAGTAGTPPPHSPDNGSCESPAAEHQSADHPGAASDDG